MAKSLAGGMPLSAVSGRAGDGRACAGGLGGYLPVTHWLIAAAHAMLDVIDEDDLLVRARRHQNHHLVESTEQSEGTLSVYRGYPHKAQWWRRGV